MDQALFAYGTLLVPEVFELVVGRRVAGSRAVLEGHVRRRLHGAVYPALVPRHSEKTLGQLYPGLSKEELARVDAFEGERYVRRPCVVETSEGVKHAAVYVLRSEHGGLLDGRDWDLAAFEREELEDYLEGCRRFAERLASS
ncbi:MAG: gamma-glutamylcyclotransferase [Deltaproteobacteria bacterium]|nr:gamma-glutamylcyclotransferase [Deltaproteobacteria bacterium]